MPKSKRSRVVALTKVKTQGHPRKQKLIERVHESLQERANVYVFAYGSLPASHCQEMKIEWANRGNSSFVMGKNTIMQLALQSCDRDAVIQNATALSMHLRGKTGLLFTDQPRQEVESYFKDYVKIGFAPTNYRVSETVVLEPGLLENVDHSLEPVLRKLGLPTELKDGKVSLIKEYTLCTAGENIKSEQARALKLLGYKMAEYRIALKAALLASSLDEHGELVEYIEAQAPKEKKEIRRKAAADDSDEEEGSEEEESDEDDEEMDDEDDESDDE